MTKVENIDRKATLTLMCLMYVTDSLNDLRNDPTYSGVFKGRMKVCAKELTMHYDRAMEKIVPDHGDNSELIVEYYTAFSDLIEDAFNIDKEYEDD